MKLDNMEIEILKTISKYHPFSFNDISDAYVRLKSFDKIITGINYAEVFNFSLSSAIDELFKN